MATCKHCSQPLVEGRAYELGGLRWHVDCFRCSQCNDLLDSNTNMLFLGDGTLVCNNCSYFCSECNRKIEDMAILTGDQAFCSSCFTCKNCHNRIEDLKYARTSQGIFCMDCHSALLERRRRRKAVGSGPGSSQVLGPEVSSTKTEAATTELVKHQSNQIAQGQNSETPTCTTPSRQYTPSDDAPPALGNTTLPDPIEFDLDFSDQPSPINSIISVAGSPSRGLQSPIKTKANRDNKAEIKINPQSLRFDSAALGIQHPAQQSSKRPNVTASPAASVTASSHQSSSTKGMPQTPMASSAGFPGQTPERSTMAVPTRSDLRPSSPARSWLGFRSPKLATPRAQSQTQTPRTPMTAPTSAVTYLSGDSVTGMVTGHSRSLSDTLSLSPDFPAAMHTSSHRHQRSLGSLASEGGVANELEVLRGQVSELKSALSDHERLQGTLESLKLEVADMEARKRILGAEVASLEHKHYQLNEMNNELTRQTMEKFGPQSLWGSGQGLQPSHPAYEGGSASPVPSQESSETPSSSKRAESDRPLVTVLEPAKSPLAGHGQPKSKNRWWKRPARHLATAASVPLAFAQTGLQAGFQPPGHEDNHGFGSATQVPIAQLQNVQLSGNPGWHSHMLGDSLNYRIHFDGQPVPIIVEKCLAEVERRGMDVEGIYRKSGSKLQVDAILEYFARAGAPDGFSSDDSRTMEEVLDVDIHAITGAVKQYMRHLSDPVIPFDWYDAFIAAGHSGSPHVVRRVVQSLPPQHGATLCFVVAHLARVASHGDENRMPGSNLAVVFAPTLARDPDGTREFMDMQARNDATMLLISIADTLSDPDSEDPPPESFAGAGASVSIMPDRPTTPV